MCNPIDFKEVRSSNTIMEEQVNKSDIGKVNIGYPVLAASLTDEENELTPTTAESKDDIE